MSDAIVQVRKLRDRDALRNRLAELAIDLPVDDVLEPDGPLAQPLVLGGVGLAGRRLGNRWAVLPMEGWDGTDDGRPTDLVRRRWRRFGQSGAALIWGGEAVAVVPEGRANPHQLCIGPTSTDDLGSLRAELVAAHDSTHGSTDGLVIGLQLTHSGRWSRPHGEPQPRVAYRHPWLDDRVGVADADVLSDDELDELVGAFVAAARVAADAGFDFVDVKQCHGYLAHELLSGVDRPGRYGGDLDGRTRFVRSVIEGITAAVPGLGVASRISVYDLTPHGPDHDGIGSSVVTDGEPYRFAFGGDGTVAGIDATEVDLLVGQLAALGIGMICVTAGSPYYAPHAQRPAFFPPSDGYLPPHDPLVDVANMVAATARLARAHPDLVVVGSGLSYLQEWLPDVAQALVRDGSMAVAGLGRMVLSYPTLPTDVAAGRPLARGSLCRTFSDCTTAPRHGLVSGCYPLDDAYKHSPQRVELTRVKRAAEAGRGRRRP